MEPKLVKQLVQMSRDALRNAYCPYSNFPVGAALLCDDGSIYTGNLVSLPNPSKGPNVLFIDTGCNIETATLLGICAERCAFAKAISDGHRKYKAIAVSSNLDTFIPPCGTCRQFMIEFGDELQVIITRKDLTYEIEPLSALLPRSFVPNTLEQFNAQNAL